jgi:hypothetical protein
MEASVHFHMSLFTTWKAPAAHWERGWVSPRSGLDAVEKRGNHFSLSGIEPRFLVRPVSVVTMPTELFLLLSMLKKNEKKEGDKERKNMRRRRRRRRR